MTSPGHGFGAHDCNLVSFCGLKKGLDAGLEFRRLHIIGEAAKRGVVPSHVERVSPDVAQSAQPLHVRVPNAGPKQRLRQCVSIELWIVPGPWDCPYIHYSLHAVNVEHLNKCSDASRRVANRPDLCGPCPRTAMRGLCKGFPHLVTTPNFDHVCLAGVNRSSRRFPNRRISSELAGDLFEPLRQINILL